MNEQTTLARSNNGALERTSNDLAEPIQILDTYAGGAADEGLRVDSLATISAGFRGQPGQGQKVGLPQASRDGKIHVHGDPERVPGLIAALEAGEGKRLTIALPVNEPRAFLQQRFMAYTASALLAYGDEHKITVIQNGEHVVRQAGTAEYERAVKSCKVATSLYFTLAEYRDSKPVLLFPDGLGFYRLRTTSRHSLRNLQSQLELLRRLTQGRLAGIPLELSISYREVSDPTGAKRTIPVWSVIHKPPAGLVLDARTFRSIALEAQQEAAQLSLPAPGQETMDVAEFEQATDADVARLESGAACDKGHWLARWHALAEGTIFDSPEERERFIADVTDGRFHSLARLLDVATEGQASNLIETLAANIRAIEDVRPERHMASVVANQRAALAVDAPIDRPTFLVMADALGYPFLDDAARALGVERFGQWIDQNGTHRSALERLHEVVLARAETPGSAAEDSSDGSEPEPSDSTPERSSEVIDFGPPQQEPRPASPQGSSEWYWQAWGQLDAEAQERGIPSGTAPRDDASPQQLKRAVDGLQARLKLDGAAGDAE